MMLTSHMDTARTTANIKVIIDEKTGKISSDGKTILGADNRQGMAILLYLLEIAENNPEIGDFTVVLRLVKKQLWVVQKICRYQRGERWNGFDSSFTR
ncbi:MAG: hypothetical protein IPJ75_03825 [Ignavibacteriales bacterium]|nr:hypothetical protein [Ignavibacteriales bacterium]